MQDFTTEFALAFLMPEEEYRRIVMQNTDDGIVNTKAVADYFHVRISDAAQRGVMLGILKASAIWRYLLCWL